MYTCLQVINSYRRKAIHKSSCEKTIVTLYHVVHIEIKYFLRQRTLKTVSLAFAGTLNNSDVILWIFARGNLRILVSDFSFLRARFVYPFFSFSNERVFCCRVTEKQKERERVAPTRDSANRGTANRRINTPSSNCGVTSVGSDHERERRRLHFSLSLPASLSLFPSKRVDMHGATTTLQHETQESIIILLLTHQFKVYRVY